MTGFDSVFPPISDLLLRAFLKNPEIQALAPYLLLAVSILAAYSNVYHNVFLFDDQTLILQNGYITGKLPLSHIFISSAAAGAGIVNDFYRPLQILLYAIVYAVFGFSTIAFHALNIGLHIANTCLVYALGRKLGFKPVAVFFGSLIWALHPLHTEAITYMSATADTLHVVFCLTVLLMVLPDASPKRIWQSVPVFALGLMSKETAVVLPALAVICLFLVNPERKNLRLYLRTWPLWVLAAGYIILRLTVLDFQRLDHSFEAVAALRLYHDSIIIRIYTFLATLPFYLQFLFDPAGLHFERQFPVYTSIANIDVFAGFLIFLIAAAACGIGLLSGAWPLSWALLWFAVAHSLDSGIVMPLAMRLLEHWMYLPSIGLCLGFSETAANLGNYKWTKELQGFMGIIALGIAVVFGFMTYEQNKIWKDDFSFYPNILKYGEPSVRAINNLGRAYADRGEYDKALTLFRQAEHKFDALPEVHQNIAHVMVLMPDWKQHPEEPIAELKRALELNPNFLQACEGLEFVYTQLGDQKNAAIYHKRGEEIRKLLIR